MTTTPEALARQHIDAALTQAGWTVQNRTGLNVHAHRGVAVREFALKQGYGFADYLLYVDQEAVGAVEAMNAEAG
jgi:type I restriction enzyme, R subunit